MLKKTPIALSIAGFDPSSGAGITADLHVFAALGLYGTSAITVMTVQSTLGVAGTEVLSEVLLRRTLDHLQADLPPSGIKIGALGDEKNAAAIAAWLRDLPQNPKKTTNLFSVPSVVLDPILRSSSGHDLYPAGAVEALHGTLLPLVHWITPNWTELSLLSGRPVDTSAEAETAANALAARHPNLNIVVTAGDQPAPTDLLRTSAGDWHSFPGEHLTTRATHGTGCAFSSALLSRLILGDAPAAAVAAAKQYVTEAIRQAPEIGHGKGPLNLLWPLKIESGEVAR